MAEEEEVQGRKGTPYSAIFYSSAILFYKESIKDYEVEASIF